MKFKRILIIVGVIVIFAICFATMNKNYDVLSRYPYDDEKAKELIKEHLNESEIEYIITYSINPDNFIDFIECPGFNIYHMEQYHRVKNYCFYLDNNDVVSLTENIISKTENYDEMISLLEHYHYTEILFYLDYGDVYNPKSILVENPDATNVILNENRTIINHVPSNLVNINDDILVRGELKESYDNFCRLVDTEFVSENCGGITITKGYIPYEEYVANYLLKGLKIAPGHNEHQTGLAIDIDLTNSIFNDDEKLKWFKENIVKYSFLFNTCEFTEIHLRYYR